MTAPQLEPLAVGAAQAGRLIGVDRSTIYRLIERGEIRTVQLGGRRLIEVEELRRLLAEHRVGEREHPQMMSRASPGRSPQGQQETPP